MAKAYRLAEAILDVKNIEPDTNIVMEYVDDDGRVVIMEPKNVTILEGEGWRHSLLREVHQGGL